MIQVRIIKPKDSVKLATFPKYDLLKMLYWYQSSSKQTLLLVIFHIRTILLRKVYSYDKQCINQDNLPPPLIE